ncbi:hypothetical protein NEOLEDRAFT_723883 [Neolentinus lepideus HHB14362 ss-1]|uniref:F-box domain-containing protein n=1 Tax=Neolentinus lepideus HHB14362 ss-1 TaxID=1314782 RepID=A0A165Q393_9AGAM|nr:hypothetical protein NEOLEDRAFT_723883 [Neolentinus lepideus HHB14362 ss-1]
MDTVEVCKQPMPEATPFDADPISTASRADIEEQIQIFIRRQDVGKVTQLKRALNSLVPIASLPDDLLIEIFALYPYAEDQSRSKFDPLIPTPYHWLRYTHVCHHWRHVALQTPILWTDIVLINQNECIKEMLIRSGQAPVEVSSAPGRLAPMDMLKICLDELHRVQSLNIRVSPGVVEELADAEYREDGQLESLSVSLGSAYPWISDHGLSEALGVFLTGVGSRKLKKLQVIGIHLFPNLTPAFPLLTSFSWSTPSPRLAVNDFLYFLQSIPSLQVLKLWDVFRPHRMSAKPTLHTSLPCLKELHMSNEYLPYEDLLPYLHLTRDASLNLDVHGVDTHSHLMSFLSLLHSAALSNELLAVELIRYENSRIEFKGWEGAFSHEIELGRAAPIPKLRLLIELASEFEDSMHVPDQLLEALPVATVDYLRLRNTLNWHWYSAFAKMRNVTKLYVAGELWDVPEALVFSCIPPESRGLNDPELRLFPRLRYLRLKEPENVQTAPIFAQKLHGFFVLRL